VDLQLPMPSVPIITNVVSSYPDHGDAYAKTTLCDKVDHLRQVGGFLRISSTKRTDRHHDITEILLSPNHKGITRRPLVSLNFYDQKNQL